MCWPVAAAEMYCPKCKQSFEEGSRRFCPTDGARLMSDTPFAAGRRPGAGIFSNLISKTETSRDLDESISNIPQFVITEPEPSKPAPKKQEFTGDFFEFEEVEPDPTIDPVLKLPTIAEQKRTASERAKTEAKPAARKIKPFEIPAGHVEVGKKNQPGVRFIDFDADDPDSFVGQTVKGRYTVTEFLGGDEESYAFLADDNLVEDKMVLVRILAGGRSDTGSSLDEEIVALSHITHPNIARLIDSGQFKGETRFLISEYIDALSVDDVLSIHERLDGVRTARIIRQVANALNETHQEGIVHRDLRPENIIVTPAEGENEQAILVNFGASSGRPNEYNIGYKAPEVFEGNVSTIPNDIFSLAVVAYEMLTGAMPFEAASAKAMVKAQSVGLAQLPTEIRPEFPAEVDRIFEKALAFDPEDRYPKARDFGDALYAALTEVPKPAEKVVTTAEVIRETPPSRIQAPPKPAPVSQPVTAEPAWKNRSLEPPQVGNTLAKVNATVGILILLMLLAFGWYYVIKNPGESNVAPNTDQAAQTNAEQPVSPPVVETEMPPLARNIPQPENTNFYQNSKQNLKGDLLRNFVGFTMYYPKDWKANGPQQSASSDSRGKFLDIARLTQDGRPKEQMLVSYYRSKGTYKNDAATFPQLVKETNETLKKLLPGYQMVSEGEIKINGDWRAYEVKFQGSGESESGEKLTVWGRRLFIPAARPGVKNGFEITMLATSLADEVTGVNDVGVKGELASILYSFEPSQNF